MRITVLVLVAACDGGRSVHPGGQGGSGAGGGVAPVCLWTTGPGAPLLLEFDPFPSSELPVSYASDVRVVLHERTRPWIGRLLFEDDSGKRTDLRYTVPAPEVAPAVDTGARVELEYSISSWAFQLATGVAIRVQGRPLWLASIDAPDPAPIRLRAACGGPTDTCASDAALRSWDVDALVSAGGREVPARAGDVVPLPGRGTFLLAWWWDTCGCCYDPPSSQAWAYASGLTAP